VPDAVWTEVAFDEVDWDNGGGFDAATGGFVAGQRAKFHFAAGVRLAAPDVPKESRRAPPA
jgi:cystathionine beta-lyase family protein involved in aluminum resistance